MKKFYQKKSLTLLFFCIYIISFCPISILSDNINQKLSSEYENKLQRIETKILGFSNSEKPLEERISTLEKYIFTTESNSQALDFNSRIDKLEKIFLVSKTKMPESFKKPPAPLASASNPQSSEREFKKEIERNNKEYKILENQKELSNLIIEIINEERKLRKLRQFDIDEIAGEMALKHASYLVQTGQFSYYGKDSKNPDLRYTEEGGDGRVSEIVNGFFSDKPIEINKELAHQFVDSILNDEDKKDIIFNKEANLINTAFVLSPNKKQLAVVIEVIATGANLSPLKNQNNEISISGRVQDDYKFAWIGLSKEEYKKIENIETEASLYFPPIDQVIYLDKKSSNAKTAAQFGGMILATVAAPFTYGVSMLLMEVLLQQVNSVYQTHDVEVKGGVTSQLDGNFYATIPLGELGRGIYYITIWVNSKDSFSQKMDKDKKSKPIIISRRAVLVE